MKIETLEFKEFKPIAPLVEEVLNLHLDLFPNVYKIFEYDGIQKATGSTLLIEFCKVFITQMRDVTIGYIMILIKLFSENAFHYSFSLKQITRLSVGESYKRTGIDAILTGKAEAAVKELNIKRLELDHLDNKWLANSYFS
ncbi:MAG: hypothetical protein IPO86_05285 [Saprospiraceae bacterium]|nr:hypothetical protein [Saprospiraceae bacterium]MBK9727515.1 hypothetical protein [Saprospiraceae bacterium]